MVYPDGISKVLASITRAGVRDSNCVGTEPNLACGTFVRFRLDIAEPEMKVRDASFTSNGCGYTIATAQIIAEYLTGKQLGDLHGLDSTIFDEAISKSIGPIPVEREACRTTVVAAVRAAFSDLRSRRLEEFRGERALICTCFGVTEDRIVSEIEAGDLEEVEDVTRVCNAGGGCGSCHMLIRELLDSHAHTG